MSIVSGAEVALRWFCATDLWLLFCNCLAKLLFSEQLAAAIAEALKVTRCTLWQKNKFKGHDK